MSVFHGLSEAALLKVATLTELSGPVRRLAAPEFVAWLGESAAVEYSRLRDGVDLGEPAFPELDTNDTSMVVALMVGVAREEEAAPDCDEKLAARLHQIADTFTRYRLLMATRGTN